jgi:hypothetical protein
MKYIRDSATGALFLRDRKELQRFSEKQMLEQEIRVLKNEINTLKSSVQELKAILESIKESK